MKPKKNKSEEGVKNNLVAKHMNAFNKPKTHKDKKKDYKRKPKHKSKFMENVDDGKDDLRNAIYAIAKGDFDEAEKHVSEVLSKKTRNKVNGFDEVTDEMEAEVMEDEPEKGEEADE